MLISDASIAESPHINAIVGQERLGLQGQRSGVLTVDTGMTTLGLQNGLVVWRCGEPVLDEGLSRARSEREALMQFLIN
jgi:hypothetical protein